MKSKTTLSLCLMLSLIVGNALALNPDDELWIPAAARGAGNDGSFWMTDLYIMNLGEETASVDITWLARNQDNSEAEGESFMIEGGATLVLEDIILEVFGQDAAAGAIHIEVEEDDGDKNLSSRVLEDEDEITLVANARIYAVDDDGETVGQGFEGLVSDAAVDDEDPTHVVGITDNGSFRSNWYGLNISMDDETDEPEEAEVLVEVLTTDGDVLTSRTYELGPLEAVLHPVADLGAGDLEDAVLRFTMIEGDGLFGASKVDRASNDPTTLEAHWECEEEDEGDLEFTSDFFIEGCTFATTGRTTWWILEPGLELVLEGEEDGEELEVIITVLDETEVVDGVECRVVEEHESEGGELVEVSRNFWALCQETGDIFYFGEDVDDYEDGVIVGHEGAWRAGENGAEPGIILPGRFMTGMRYYQEIAPGVALDRSEHLEMGLTVETEAGTFENCAAVNDSSDFEPDAEDLKIYCPGIGQVADQELELVEWTDPTNP